MKDLTKLPYWTEAETLDALCFHDSEEHHARWDELLRKLPPGAEHADENNRRKATLTTEGDALVRKRNEAQKLLSYAVFDEQLTIKKLDGEKLFRPAEVAQWVKDHHAADFPKFPKDIKLLDDAARKPASVEQKMPVKSGASASNDWKTEARQMADELDAKDMKADVWSSLTDIADRIAKKWRDEGKVGSRGPRSGAYILKDALQGSKWKRKR